MLWKLTVALGILGILLGAAIAGVSAALPILNGPRTSWEEAMYGIIPGVAILVISFFILAAGLIFMIIARKKVKSSQI